MDSWSYGGKTMKKEKEWNENKTEEYKKWFKSLGFHYHITIGMKPDKMIKKYTLQKHLDYLEFRLNKLYLDRNWSNRSVQEKFYFLGFHEGNLGNGTSHYHLLLHVPDIYRNKDVDIKDSIREHYRGKQPISDIKHVSEYENPDVRYPMKDLRIIWIQLCNTVQKYREDYNNNNWFLSSFVKKTGDVLKSSKNQQSRGVDLTEFCR